MSAPADPPRIPTPKASGDDRAALLHRGRQTRTVRTSTAHHQAAAEAPASPERIDPALITGTDDERLGALEGALDQAGTRAQMGIEMVKAWLDEQRGVVLREIRDSHLYRVKAATFEEYAASRWQMSRPRAYALITAAPVLRVMSSIEDTRPAVSQALALAPVYERDGERGVREVMREAGAAARTSGTRVTAASLTRTVRGLGYGPARQDDAQRKTEAGGDQEQRQARALEALAADAEAQRRMYDRLAEIAPLARAHDPGRADEVLREYRQYASRTAHRARRPDSE